MSEVDIARLLRETDPGPPADDRYYRPHGVAPYEEHDAAAELDQADRVALLKDDATEPFAPTDEPTPEFDAPPTEPGFTLPTFTARELVALPDTSESDMLCGPLAMRSARTIVVADTGHGKTTFCLQLGAAILTGREMLGYRGAGVGPIVVVDLEQGIRSIKRTLRDAGLADHDDVIYVPVPDGLALDDEQEEHRAALGRIIAERRPAVLILDPYYKAHRSDANEERAVVDLMRYLDALRAAFGFALILPAHPRKDPASQTVRKLSLHDVAGSGAVTRGAELVLGLERLSHGYARLRFLKDRDNDLPVGEAWPLLFSREEGFRLDPKEEQTAEELQERVLADTGEWRTVKEWKSVLSVGEAKARELLESLVETGHVDTAEGPPGRSPKARCYRTALGASGQSRAVDENHVSAGTAPTAPTSIGDVGSGGSPGTALEPGAVDDDEELNWR